MRGDSPQWLDVGRRYGDAGPHLQGPHLRAMIEQAKPTLTAMVPTLLGDLLLADESASLDLSCFRAIVSGGPRCPRQ